MELKTTGCNLINGEWIRADQTTPNINPSDLSDIIGEYACASTHDVTLAAAAAKAAFPRWRETTSQLRSDLLDQVGNILIARKNEIGRMLSREEGKPLVEGISETLRAGQIFKYFAQEALRISGDAIASVRTGVDVEVTREPVGVAALITPWNFPIAIPAWKSAPALAYGNTVVLKPADLTPASAHILAEVVLEAGIPNGVFNLVNGPGATVGQALVENPDIDAISFTGSVPIGRRIASDCGTTKRLQLEMGGKNPLVVLDDADLDLAVNVSVNGAFYSTGQRCTASSRLIVHKDIHDAFVEKLIREMRSLRVGCALDTHTQIGPVASERQLQSNLRYVTIARDEGATVLGGECLSLDKPGYYQSPALFLGAKNTMRVAREEIFGPCATVIKADNFEEAIHIANDTEFGLSSGICTRSLKQAREFKRLSQAGMVMVNLPTAGVDYHVPFGGSKGSSYGPREQGRYAIDFFTKVKTGYTNALV